jgi:hypothetical protein
MSKAALDEIPMGIEAAAAIDPSISYALPHAAVVMDPATTLRDIAADVERSFGAKR